MPPTSVKEIVCAHSPDSDDAYMFYGLATKKVRSRTVSFRHVLEDINLRQFAQETIDVTGMTTIEQVRDAVMAMREDRRLDGGVIRATLVGERDHALTLDPQTLSMECSDGFAYLEFADHSRVSHDLEAAAQEFTSRGEMVRKLVDHKQGSRQEEQAVGRALQLALDAFDE